MNENPDFEQNLYSRTSQDRNIKLDMILLEKLYA